MHDSTRGDPSGPPPPRPPADGEVLLPPVCGSAFPGSGPGPSPDQTDLDRWATDGGRPADE